MKVMAINHHPFNNLLRLDNPHLNIVSEIFLWLPTKFISGVSNAWQQSSVLGQFDKPKA